MIKGRMSRWVAVAVLLLVVLMAFSWLMSGEGGGSDGERAKRYLASPQELGDALSAPEAVFRRTNPPVDVDQIERSARSLTLDRVPLPDEHDVATYLRADTGAEITQAVLLYDDPAAAANLDRLASSLLAGAFHLRTEPMLIEGAQDGRRWWTDGYAAVSFRRDGVVVFLGTTDPSFEADLLALARQTIVKLSEHPPQPPTVTGG